MAVLIQPYTEDRIDDVIRFEHDIRIEEEWGWEINEEYLKSVRACFRDDAFRDSVSLLAYMDGKVVGRIDSTMIKSKFDGSTKAYLDWICVVKRLVSDPLFFSCPVIRFRPGYPLPGLLRFRP